MKSFELERFEAIILNQTIQKTRFLGMGREFMTKMAKSNKGGASAARSLGHFLQFFSMPIFSSTEFSIVRISSVLITLK